MRAELDVKLPIPAKGTTYKEILATLSSQTALPNGQPYFSAASVIIAAERAVDTPKDIHQLVCMIRETEDVIALARKHLEDGKMEAAWEVLKGY